MVVIFFGEGVRDGKHAFQEERQRRMLRSHDTGKGQQFAHLWGANDVANVIVMEKGEIENVDGQDSRVVQALTDCVGGLNAFVCVLLSCVLSQISRVVCGTHQPNIDHRWTTQFFLDVGTAVFTAD